MARASRPQVEVEVLEIKLGIFEIDEGRDTAYVTRAKEWLVFWIGKDGADRFTVADIRDGVMGDYSVQYDKLSRAFERLMNAKTDTEIGIEDEGEDVELEGPDLTAGTLYKTPDHVTFTAPCGESHTVELHTLRVVLSAFAE